MKLFSTILASLALSAALLLASLGAAEASLARKQKVVNISGDRGGVVITYALKVLKAKENERFVRVSGSCASACTLYLSMPKERICITRNASFKFHLPYGASRKGNQVAAQYLMRNYPGWVRSWISSNGGLSPNLKTMPYSYASRFLATCAQA
ncbi:hypothetical protein [Aestuariivirga sp.]|uniref:hypothetical protein n=1 Tax=Aestuariivirga sp. TaxID=2650926 RepID=UPI003919A541